MYLCSMVSQNTSISDKIFFTAQQKINTNICYILLFFIVNNNDIKPQYIGIQYFDKFPIAPVLLLFYSISGVLVLLFHCYLAKVILYRNKFISVSKNKQFY